MITVYVVFALLVLNGVGMFLYVGFGKLVRLYHDILGCHQPDMTAIMNCKSASLQCRCKYCNKRLFQDSQGVWY